MTGSGARSSSCAGCGPAGRRSRSARAAGYGRGAMSAMWPPPCSRCSAAGQRPARYSTSASPRPAACSAGPGRSWRPPVMTPSWLPCLATCCLTTCGRPLITGSTCLSTAAGRCGCSAGSLPPPGTGLPGRFAGILTTRRRTRARTSPPTTRRLPPRGHSQPPSAASPRRRPPPPQPPPGAATPRRSHPPAQPPPGAATPRRSRPPVRPASGVAADHRLAEPGHFLTLRRELQQHQADAGLLVSPEPLDDLVRGADQSAAQPAVGDAVLLDRDARLKLRALDEVLVGGVRLRGGADIEDPVQLGLGLGLGIAADHVPGDAEHQRRAGVQVGDLGGDDLG